MRYELDASYVSWWDFETVELRVRQYRAVDTRPYDAQWQHVVLSQTYQRVALTFADACEADIEVVRVYQPAAFLDEPCESSVERIRGNTAIYVPGATRVGSSCIPESY